MRARNTTRVALVATSTLLLAGCLSDGGDSGGGGGGAGGDGEVEIMYGFANEQSDAFIEHVGAWAEGEGINVKFSPTPDFDKLVRSRVQGNNLPDIAIFPQPGITLDIGRSGKLADLRDVLDMDALEASVVPGILDAATDEEGAIFAAPISISVKSLVWYPKAPFEAAGYEIPTSQEELPGADRADQGRWHGAVVHRDRERPGDRVAGHRLAGGLRAARRWDRGVRPVGQARDPVR